MKHLLITALLCTLSATCLAQSQSWNENRLQWVAPTTCTSGQPIANCPLTGYRVERSASTSGVFAAVGTSPTTSFTHTAAVAGQNCYRVIVLSARGESMPSKVACKTNVEPSGTPNPATDLTVLEPTAYDLRIDESRYAVVRGREVGSAKLGAACDQHRTTGQGYFALARPSRVRLTREPRSGSLVAKCAASS